MEEEVIPILGEPSEYIHVESAAPGFVSVTMGSRTGTASDHAAAFEQLEVTQLE